MLYTPTKVPTFTETSCIYSYMPDFSYIYPIITRSCAAIPEAQIKIIDKITRKIKQLQRFPL